MKNVLKSSTKSLSLSGLTNTLRRSRGLGVVALLLLCATGSGLAQALQPGGPTDFGTQTVGGSFQVTLTFSASVTTTISSVVTTTDGTTGKDFTVANQTCTGVQNPPSSCSITMQFSPTQIGLRKGALSITDGSGTVVNRVYLHGIGTGPQVVFGPRAASVAASSPANSVYDGAGNLFSIDLSASTIVKRSPSGAITTLATIPATPLSSIAISGAGTLYISAPSQGLIYSLIPGGTPAVLPTGSVTMTSPAGLAIDGSGYLYAADSVANRIVRIALDGSAATPLTLSGLATPLAVPIGLTMDAANNLYIADSANDRIVKLGLFTGAASVVTISGQTMLNPHGLAIDGAGTLYVADTGNKRILVVPPALAAYSLATPNATLVSPTGVLLAGNGDLLLSDTGLGLVYLLRSSLGITFPTATKVGTIDATDGIITFTLQNTGNYALKLPTPTSGTNPAINSKAFVSTVPGHTCPLLNPASPGSTPSTIALGASCNYVVQFSPTNTGTNAADFVVSYVDAAGSGLTYSSDVPLSGIGLSDVTSFTIVANPSLTGVGQPVSYTVTALAGTVPSSTYLGTVTFTSTDPTAQFLSGTTYIFTAADAGVHVFDAAGGVKFNQVGTFTISAADNNLTGLSNAVKVVPTPSVSFTSSINPVLITNPTTLTSTVSFTGTTPTGTVTFYDGTTALSGPVSLNASGIASLSVSFAVGGQHSLTAVYSGDTSFAQTTSPTITETAGDMTLTVAPGASDSATTTPGKPASFSLLFAPAGLTYLPSDATLSVTGLPAGTTAVFSPASLPSQSIITPITLTITPPFGAAAKHNVAMNRVAGAGGIALAILGLPLILLGRRRRMQALASLALLMLLAGSTMGLTGCLSDANSGYYGFTPYSTPITVTVTSGNLSRSVTLTLNVTQ